MTRLLYSFILRIIENILFSITTTKTHTHTHLSTFVVNLVHPYEGRDTKGPNEKHDDQNNFVVYGKEKIIKEYK